MRFVLIAAILGALLFSGPAALSEGGVPVGLRREAPLSLSAQPKPDPAPRAVRRCGSDAHCWAQGYWFQRRRADRLAHQTRSTLRRVYYSAPWGNHPDERKALCVHGYEGSWRDSSAPFWGGMQMDRSFYETYGGWAVRVYGTPDKWPVAVQIAVALRAVHSGRGWYPWPNTARMCGLL